MRTGPQVDAIAMSQGTSALYREDCEFRNRFAPQPARSPETQPPQISRPHDFEVAVNNPTQGWPARQILFPIWEPTRPSRNPIPGPCF